MTLFAGRGHAVGARHQRLQKPGMSSANRIKPGGLDKDVAGLFGTSRPQTAHHSTDALRTLGVTNEGFAAVKFIGLFIQCFLENINRSRD